MHLLKRILRECIRGLVDAVYLITRRPYTPNLIPTHQLESRDDKSQRWVSTGNDPQFKVGGLLPMGLTKGILIASSNKPGRSGFYLDFGKGFSQSTFVSIGVVTPEPRSIQFTLPLSLKLRAIRFDPIDTQSDFEIQEIRFKRITNIELVFLAVFSWLKRVQFRPVEVKYAVSRFFSVTRQVGWKSALRLFTTRISQKADLYNYWLEHHALDEHTISRIKSDIDGLEYHPLISILMPVYNTDERWLREAIDSVIAQIYPNWQLCIADDASTNPAIARILNNYLKMDSRIQVVWRKENGHISAASNSALEIAKGEYIATLDHDDKLTPDALFEVVSLLNDHRESAMIYTDEDKISESNQRFIPYFKPDWSPDLFLSQMYTAHLGVYRTDLVREIGGYRLGYEGAQDYDLVLRLTEKTRSIYHIPKVLYSWRRTIGSTAIDSKSKTYAYKAAANALSDAIHRRNQAASISHVPDFPGHFIVHWELTGNPLVSIIILSKDNPTYLSRCLESIFSKTTYQNFEIVLVDNGSRLESTADLLAHWKQQESRRFHVERNDIPFNFSALNNNGAHHAKGQMLLFLNDDTEVITPNWLEEMGSQAQRDQSGVVGAMLLYPDQTIQHAGIILGIGEWAGHSHKGHPADNPGFEGRLLGPSNYSAITGACLMIRSNLYHRLGGFNEDLSVACGDVELCLKAMDLGYYNIVLPHVRLYHHESITRGYEDTPEKQTRFAKEIHYVKSRWPVMFDADPYYNPHLTHWYEDFSLELIV